MRLLFVRIVASDVGTTLDSGWADIIRRPLGWDWRGRTIEIRCSRLAASEMPEESTHDQVRVQTLIVARLRGFSCQVWPSARIDKAIERPELANRQARTHTLGSKDSVRSARFRRRPGHYPHFAARIGLGYLG